MKDLKEKKKKMVSKFDMTFSRHADHLNDQEKEKSLEKYFKQRSRRKNG